LPNPGSSKNELFVVDLNGKLTQLTNLEKYFPNEEIGNLSWSSNSRYIAFWMLPDFNDMSTSHLLLTDITTKETTDFCIPGTQGIGNVPDFDYGRLPAPKWSLDNRYLAFTSLTNEGTIQTVIVDVVEKTAYLISKVMRLEGWTIGQP